MTILTTQQRNSLTSVVLKAQKIIGSELPALSSLNRTRLQRRAQRIIQDSTHPAHNLFELLPSGRRYRVIRSKTERMKNSLFCRAVLALNEII